MERNFRLVYSDSSLQFCSVLFVCFTQNQDCNSGMLFWVALLRFQILSVIVFASLRCQNGIVQFLWFTQTPDSISGVFCLFYSDSILQIWSILFVCFTQALDLDCSFYCFTRVPDVEFSFWFFYLDARFGSFILFDLLRLQIWGLLSVYFTYTPYSKSVVFFFVYFNQTPVLERSCCFFHSELTNSQFKSHSR